MPELRIALLGPLHIRKTDGAPVTLPTRKAQGLLAYLAANREQLHSREKLATLLWGDTGEEQARQSLRQALFAIRRASKTEIIRTESDRIGIVAGAIETDVDEFVTAVADRSIPSLEKAAALYRGDFLEGMTLDEEGFDTWVDVERVRLRELALQAFEQLAEAYAAANRLNDATVLALRTLAIDPIRESLHRLVMQLYARQGRRDSAIRQYHTCADVLRKKLGVDPDIRTKQLLEEITASSADLPEHADAPPAILVVEDNALNRELLRVMLRDEPYEVNFVGDGTQALIQLGRKKYDLVIADIGLPTLDGMTLMRVMNENGFSTPVIFLTAYQDQLQEARALDLGAADYLRKPVQRAVLLKRIEMVLEKNATHQHGDHRA